MLELSHINKELLYKVLASPSFSEKELRLQEFLMEYASQKDYECSIDDKGNIYMAKGKLSDGMNFGAGYYLYHTLNEYVVPEEMDNATTMGLYLIDRLGYKEYVLPFCPRYRLNEEDKDSEWFRNKFKQ